jgi:phage protein D
MPVADEHGPLVPDFDVSINGTPLSADAQAHVVSLTVDDSIELPGMFTLEIGSSDELDKKYQWVDDKELFAPGHEVEVKMGYADQLVSLFKGEITGLEPEFSADRLPSLVVRGYDRRHRLHLGRKTRTFVKMKDSDIATQVANGAGLTANVTDSKVTHDYVIQANQTDMDFLQERARLIQYEIGIDYKNLIFRPVQNGASEVMTLTMDDDLLEFHPRLTVQSQFSEVNVMYWSAKDKKALVSEAAASDVSTKMGGAKIGAQHVQTAFGAAKGVFAMRPAMTQAEADQTALANLNRRAMSFITGEGVARGHTDLRSGTVIKIDGVGERFSGQYYVTSAVHRYNPQQSYQTHFMIRRNSS